ncbi:MAG: hypothetical protein WDZ51_11055 [Pirellulaceae bacterium]
MGKAYMATALAGILAVLAWVPAAFGNLPEDLSPSARAAIEALQRNGANVNFFQSSNGGVAFHVNCYATKATPENLGNLELIPNVERLWLGGSFQLSPEAWRSISQMGELQHLYLYTAIEDEDITHLVEFSELRTLNLTAKNLTSAGLWHLEELVHLEQLTLQQISEVDESLFSNLASLPSLQGLNINLSGSQPATLTGLGKLTKLTSLNIGGPKLSGNVISEISSMVDLRTLSVSNLEASEKDLEALGNLRQLSVLNIYNSQFATEGLVHLASLEQLNNARLSNSNIGDEGLAVLAKLPKLQYLELNQTDVTDEGLAHLKDSTNLSSLHVRGTKVTKEGIEALNARLPKLRIITSLGNP